MGLLAAASVYDYDDAHDHARWLLSFARLGVGSLAVICVFSVIQSRLEVLMLLLPLLFGVVALTPPPPQNTSLTALGLSLIRNGDIAASVTPFVWCWVGALPSACCLARLGTT